MERLTVGDFRTGVIWPLKPSPALRHLDVAHVEVSVKVVVKTGVAVCEVRGVCAGFGQIINYNTTVQLAPFARLHSLLSILRTAQLWDGIKTTGGCVGVSVYFNQPNGLLTSFVHILPRLEEPQH